MQAKQASTTGDEYTMQKGETFGPSQNVLPFEAHFYYGHKTPLDLRVLVAGAEGICEHCERYLLDDDLFRPGGDSV